MLLKSKISKKEDLLLRQANKGLILISLIILSACQTTPVNYSSKTQGFWKAKALIKNKKSQNSHIVYLDINAIKNKKLRMDIISPLGGHLASIILNGRKASYLNLEKRKIYVGKASARTMKKVSSVPIDPTLFYNVVFDLPVKRKTWNCVKDDNEILKFCLDLKTGTKVSWGKSIDAKKTVYIENKAVKLQINFKSFKDEVEARSNLFEFKKISGFKTIKI